ncbi:glycine cleavage system H-protein subunit [Malassezia equina]|uniref:Glycine cleavage system H protein n=1 Tax=Malassezia equina TaxID=1381935 RepID=A0AAF0EMX4_9BASI|nr:glycine cleavage system H-protein subunit [Malassezia equina]
MMIAPLRAACSSTLRMAARAPLRVAPVPVRMFQTSRLAAEVKIYFTPEHEWIRYDDVTNEGVLGITDHAQNSLGDVVYLEMPEVQQEVSKGDQIGAIESVKAASDIYSPVSGVISEINERLNDEMALVNKSPMHDGWLAKIKVTAPGELEELLSEEAYNATLEH